MRKLMGLVLLVGLSISGAGCVLAVSNKGCLQRGCCDRQVVVLDDKIYVVDVDDCCIYRMDNNAIQNAEIFSTITIEKED